MSRPQPEAGYMSLIAAGGTSLQGVPPASSPIPIDTTGARRPRTKKLPEAPGGHMGPENP